MTDSEMMGKNVNWHQALLKVIPDLVFVVGKGGQVLEVLHAPDPNDAVIVCEIVPGQNLREMFPASVAQQLLAYLEQFIRSGQLQTLVCSLQGDEQRHEFQARFAACGEEQVLVLLRKVTSQKLVEKEILEISNREQMRIGQDLHDGLGQHLTAITFLSRALEKKLAARDLPEAASAAEIGQLVLQALAQTKNLTRGFFPVELESNGLVQALRELAVAVRKLFDISCDFECGEDIRVEDRTAANHLFRLAQEAINNSVKHGKARRVDIALRRVGDKIALSIRDDGRGFSNKTPHQNGLGLRIMNYRAQKIGGVLEIRAGKKEGTMVECLFPSSTAVHIPSAQAGQPGKTMR